MKKFFTFLLATFFLTSSAFAEMVYHRGNSHEPGSIDPRLSETVYDYNIGLDLFEGLVTFDAGGRVVPGVAEKWDISEDGTTYTFHFRDNAKWSNGDPVTPSDFIYSLRRNADPKTAGPYAWMLYPIKNFKDVNTGKNKDVTSIGVKAVDDKTLQITLTKITPYFLSVLSHSQGFPVPQKVVEKYGKNWTKNENFVSNGAFKLVAWRPQQNLEMIRNPHFHSADTVKIDRVFFYPTEDKAAALRKFRAGELDSQEQIPHGQIKWIKKNLSEEYRPSPYLYTEYYAFNTKVKPFDDVRVRKALSMAIDRKVLCENVRQMSDIPAYGFVPPNVPGFNSQLAEFSKLTQKQRDEKARELLAEAGYTKDNPLEFELRYNTDVNNEKAAIAISAMWKQKLGVKAKLFNSETAIHYNELKQHNFTVARAAWAGDYVDPQNFLFLLSSPAKNYNYGQFNNEEFDQYMLKASTTLDAKERMKLMEKAEKVAMKHQPVAPLFHKASEHIVATYVKGWEDNVRDLHLSRYLRIEK